MSAVLERIDPQASLSAAHTALDQLLELDLTGLDDEALPAFWRELERLRRRIPAVEHGLVLEAEARGFAERHQLRGVAQLLRGMLRIDPTEATGRVRAAHAAGTGRTLTGQPMPAVLPALAAAQAAGTVSERQAQLIRVAIEKLPDAVRDEHSEQIERELVGHAHRFDPIPLAKLAERIRYCYDPDGTLEDVAYREKQRELTLRRRIDGSGTLGGECTAELCELLELHFDALAKPRPEQDGIKDPRTAGQRRHDALLEAVKLNLRAQQLPTVGGVTATIVLTMTAEQYQQRTGLAATSHGALIPVPEAVRMSGADYRLMAVVLDRIKGITGYSSLRRCYTEQQRLAMLAADGPGCTFPHCPMPAHWCQIDHIVDHAHGGPTNLGNGVPACRYHNVQAKQQGWRSARINGRAAWIPPRWIDPEQKPQHNFLHNTDPPP